MRNVGRQINALLDQEDWVAARQLIRHALLREPKSHWLLTQLASTYYEQHRYAKALSISKQALKLAPACPLVLWDYACTLDMLDRTKQALGIYKQLLGRGATKVASSECGEGVRWARSLLNDCRYRIACNLEELRDAKNARKFLSSYLSHRRKGIQSIYLLSSAKKRLNLLLKKS